MGVDLQRFTPANPAQNWPPQLRLLSVGRLVSRKGHDVVIRALALIVRERPELAIILRIVGAGPERQSLVALAEELNVADRLEGPTAEDYLRMPAVYRSASLLIAASQSTRDGWEEAFCRTAVEAMGCGLPVVATPCGGLPDTVGKGGIVAAAQSPEAVATAIASLIDTAGPAHWSLRAIEAAARYGIGRMRQEYSNCARIAVCGQRLARNAASSEQGTKK
jgi:glycosyltransferase involved in cell wall biosynthesis